jgi:hypothetical protein
MRVRGRLPIVKIRPADWRRVLAAVCLTAGAAVSSAMPVMASEARTYSCSTSDTLRVQLTRAGAIVKFNGLEYRLPRKRSSIGTRYGSANAALMIDGHFATFVTERGPRAMQCFEVPSLAKRS